MPEAADNGQTALHGRGAAVAGRAGIFCGPLADPVCDSQYSGSVSFGVPAIHSIQSERLFHQRHGLCVFPAESGVCFGVRTFSLRHDLRPAAIGRGASHLLPRQGAGCGLRAGTAGPGGSGGTSFSLGGGGGKCGGRGAALHPACALQTGGAEPGDFLCGKTGGADPLYGGAAVSALRLFSYGSEGERDWGGGEAFSSAVMHFFAGVQQVLARHRHKGRRGWGGERFPGAARTRGGAGPGGGDAGGWNRPLWGTDGFPAAHPFKPPGAERFPECSRKKAVRGNGPVFVLDSPQVPAGYL